MKGILTFNLPQEDEEFQTAQNGIKYKVALEEVWERVFRPLHKHGYGNEKLQKLVDSKPEVVLAIEFLAEVYREILEENQVQ